jgi:dTDP-glucose pyrophosphorylase
MAGEGSRFSKQGFSTPKPLIQCKGKPFFLRALSSFDGMSCPKKYSFIVRQEHIDRFSIEGKIREYFSQAAVFSVTRTTRGSVETCLYAKPAIEKQDAIIVMDCDLEFYSKSYEARILEELKKPVEQVDGGGLVCFKSGSARYSYAETDSAGRVIRTAEKQVISDNAIAGAYFFSRSDAFLWAAEQLLNQENPSGPEMYLSLLYNFLIADGQTVFCAKTDQYHSFGTPEELRKYQDG